MVGFVDFDLVRLATDVALYTGAVSASLSANALTAAAASVIRRVQARLNRRDVVVVDERFIREVATILESDNQLLMDAARAFHNVNLTINADRSIIIAAENVSGITQHNN